MPNSNLRSVQLKQKKIDRGQEKKQRYIYSTLVAVGGSVSVSGKPFTSWHLQYGSSNPSQILNRRVLPRPNTPVVIGYAQGSKVLEVLDINTAGMVYDTTFLSPSYAIHHLDHEWLGEDVVFVYPEAITPLMTFPSTTGLLVNVVRGVYDYNGTEVTFLGQLDVALTAPTGPNTVRFTGLYLDSANVLQAINGSTVADTTPDTDIPEPAWPEGAFKLSVVKVLDDDTSLTYSDIFNRRLLFNRATGVSQSVSSKLYLYENFT